MDHKKIYSKQDLKKTWSHKTYKKYENAVHTWDWEYLPFWDPASGETNANASPAKKIDGSVLEIGAACGAAYQFLKASGLVDLNDYHGLEISEYGHNYCNEHFPEADWIQADFTKYDFERTYDYTFERIAVHHMPDPLSLFEKILSNTNVAMSASFVSCLNGHTISDLNVARYEHQDLGKVYFNIINPFEVIDIALKLGFNHIRFKFGGEHEEVPRDVFDYQYIDPDVNFRERIISRINLVLRKDSNIDGIRVDFFGPLDHRKSLQPILKHIPRYSRILRINEIIRNRLNAIRDSYSDHQKIHYHLPLNLL